MNGQDVLAERIAGALRSRPDLVVLGEDVRDGGLFGLSRTAAAEPDLAPRLLATPLLPGGLFGHAAGLSLGGRHPLVLAPSAAAVLDGLGDLLAAVEPATWAGMDAPPRLGVLVPTGPGLDLSEDADRPVEALLAALPGLTVLTVGQAHHLLAAFDALLDAPGPAALLVPRRLLLSPVPEGAEAPDPSGVNAVRRGRSATVFAFGETVAPALEAARGLDVAVADVWRLRPFPTEAVAEAARTGHVVVAHAGPESFVAGRIAAVCAREAVWHLDAPVEIVPGAPAPLGPAAEAAAVPSPAAIRAALTAVGAQKGSE